jgi:hypothetical protein
LTWTNTLAYLAAVLLMQKISFITMTPDVNVFKLFSLSPTLLQEPTQVDHLTLPHSNQGILKGKYHFTVGLLFDWFGLVCFAIKTKIVSCHTADSKPVKQEVNSTVILPPLVFPVIVGQSSNPYLNVVHFFNTSAN